MKIIEQIYQEILESDWTKYFEVVNESESAKNSIGW